MLNFERWLMMAWIIFDYFLSCFDVQLIEHSPFLPEITIIIYGKKWFLIPYNLNIIITHERQISWLMFINKFVTYLKTLSDCFILAMRKVVLGYVWSVDGCERSVFEVWDKFPRKIIEIFLLFKIIDWTCFWFYGTFLFIPKKFEST